MPKRTSKEAQSGDVQVTVRSKKGAERKKFKNKRFQNNPFSAVIGSGIDALPSKVFYKFKYCQTSQAITITNGVPAALSYKLNSLYDPDQAGIGHQPYLYDQYTSASGLNYQRWLVHACKWEIYHESQLQDNTAKGMTIYTVEYNKGGVSAPANAEKAIERSDRWMRVHCNNTSGTVGVDVPVWPDPHMKGFIKMKNFFGRKLDPISDAGQTSNDPTNVVYLNVFAWWPGNNVITATRYFTIRLTFYAQLYDRVQVAAS